MTTEVVSVTPAQRTAAAYLVRRAEEMGAPLADDDPIRRIADAEPLLQIDELLSRLDEADDDEKDDPAAAKGLTLYATSDAAWLVMSFDATTDPHNPTTGEFVAWLTGVSPIPFHPHYFLAQPGWPKDFAKMKADLLAQAVNRQLVEDPTATERKK